ncbi:hypothetical protein Tco_0172925 [Tanacetum coccineum]
MRISGFMHDITNPDLIKRLNDNIPKSVDEMISMTTSFLREEVAVANQFRKKTLTWRHHETSHKPSFNKRLDFKSKEKPNKRHDRFTPLIKTPKEVLAMDTGHITDECIHLRKKIEEAVKSGQLSHLVKEINQGSHKGEHLKAAKKEETPGKEKAKAIFMVQPWQRVTRQKVTQNFSTNQEISFPPLASNNGQESPMVIEAEVEGHLIHRMYVDGGSASEVLYEHFFNRLRPEVKRRMIPATTLLLGFSGEISWPLRQISLMVSLGDEEHFASA